MRVELLIIFLAKLYTNFEKAVGFKLWNWELIQAFNVKVSSLRDMYDKKKIKRSAEHCKYFRIFSQFLQSHLCSKSLNHTSQKLLLWEIPLCEFVSAKFHPCFFSCVKRISWRRELNNCIDINGSVVNWSEGEFRSQMI